MKTWMIVGAVVLVAAVAAFLILGKKADMPPNTPPTSKSEPAAEMSWTDKQAAFMAANLQQPGWKATASGLQYIALKTAEKPGPKPAPGSEVVVHYEGRLIDGKIFDSSYARNEPIGFPLSGVIMGWQEGVPLMSVGETWEFAIPAELGYGARGAPGAIPPNSALIFKIELLEAKTPAK